MSAVIVGASVAGIRTAQALRAAGYDERVVIIGAENHPPYDKPPLSKQMLAAGPACEPTPLVSGPELAALEVELRLGTWATGVDVAQRLVALDSADPVGFDDLVIATGSHPRTLPNAAPRSGIHTLRDLSDARSLQAELGSATRVVVIGAGFIGAEFASAARARGAAVTMVETQNVPMAHLLGPEVGAVLADLHVHQGVTVHAGTRVAAVLGADRVTGVALADGTVLPADLVVVGIGARPATDWLASSGLPLLDGVVCDETLQVRGHPGIWAAGDVARFRHPLYDEDVRIEHWTNAHEHAAIVAAGITGGRAPAAQVPYVWSDQYAHRIQIVGRPALGRVAVMAGSIGEGHRFVATYVDPSGTVVGALTVDDPRTLMKLRKAIGRRQPMADIELGLPVGA